jgi:predicted DCC family thiol-disulfide oxidoreductase YuxK
MTDTEQRVEALEKDRDALWSHIQAIHYRMNKATHNTEALQQAADDASRQHNIFVGSESVTPNWVNITWSQEFADLREQVARAIRDAVYDIVERNVDWVAEAAADAALAVAEPAIRKRVIEELAKKAGDFGAYDDSGTLWLVSDWLRAQQEGSEE